MDTDVCKVLYRSRIYCFFRTPTVYTEKLFPLIRLYAKCSTRVRATCELDIAGTAIEMRLLLFQSIKRPFQIPVAHFDQNRTFKYQF